MKVKPGNNCQKGLELAYENIKKKWKGSQNTLESWETVAAVHNQRMYWKPDKVRVVLLAESHVFTSDGERTRHQIDATRINGIGDIDLSLMPTDFTRFVYCLGNGENGLLTRQLKVNSGTPHFWKIFQACVNGPDAFGEILRGSTPNFSQRVSNKIALLEAIRKSHIWLLDASVVALYPKLQRNLNMRIAIEQSFDHYVGPILKDLGSPRVLIIGKGVAKVIGKKIQGEFGKAPDVIAQPNARLSAEEHLSNFEKCHEFCAIEGN